MKNERRRLISCKKRLIVVMWAGLIGTLVRAHLLMANQSFPLTNAHNIQRSSWRLLSFSWKRRLESNQLPRSNLWINRFLFPFLGTVSSLFSFALLNLGLISLLIIRAQEEQKERENEPWERKQTVLNQEFFERNDQIARTSCLLGTGMFELIVFLSRIHWAPSERKRIAFSFLRHLPAGHHQFLSFLIFDGQH